jgi:CRP/FNR family transcriptional regulator, cyclic AMP receptor protein
MSVAAMSRLRRTKGLENMSWLTAGQLEKLAAALTVSHFDKRAAIFQEGKNPEAAYILLSGVARITCRNRKGLRTILVMVAPGIIPSLPIAVPGVKYDFNCEAVTNSEVGIIAFNTFIELSLGIGSADFKRLMAMYVGRWDCVGLRCSNFMSCTLAERLALTLLELSKDFGTPNPRGMKLTVPARHQTLADMVGASRPRVTEHLIEFERSKMIVRTGREMVVSPERLEKFLTQPHPKLPRTPNANKAA